MGDGSDAQSRVWTSHLDERGAEPEDQLGCGPWIRRAFENEPRAKGEHGALSLAQLTKDNMNFLSLELSEPSMRSRGSVKPLGSRLSSTVKSLFAKKTDEQKSYEARIRARIMGYKGRAPPPFNHGTTY